MCLPPKFQECWLESKKQSSMVRRPTWKRPATRLKDQCFSFRRIERQISRLSWNKADGLAQWPERAIYSRNCGKKSLNWSKHCVQWCGMGLRSNELGPCSTKIARIDVQGSGSKDVNAGDGFATNGTPSSAAGRG